METVCGNGSLYDFVHLSHDQALLPQLDDKCSLRAGIVQSRRKRHLLKVCLRRGGGLRSESDRGRNRDGDHV